MTRLFSGEELELLATPLSIRLERAAATRDIGALEEIRREMELECTAVYDKQCLWTTALQTFIIESVGVTAHDQALRQVAETAFRPALEGYRALGPRDRVAAIARHLRANGSTFWVAEDDDRIRLLLDPAGSARLWRPRNDVLRRDGLRILYPSQGAYDEPGLAFHETVPCFFAAEILFFEVLPAELLGRPLASLCLPERATDAMYLDLAKDEPGGRLFTVSELEQLATPLSVRVEQHAAAGDWDELGELASGMDAELVAAKDPLNLLNAGLLTWIARQLGEGAVEHALARSAELVMGPAVESLRDLPFPDAFKQFVRVWRAHGSTFWIEETEETMVLRGRPMGACGRLWAHRSDARAERVSDTRVRYPTWGAYDPPLSFHLMQEPRPSACGQIGMPIYSCHCHVFHEIFPIMRIGRPLWIEEHPIHDPDGETIHIHYKDYEAWPERYYARVGLVKGR